MYYVYRFKDKKDNIIYVGRTKDLYKRFLSHMYLNRDDVYKIEYIKCSSEAEMVWKEIYYINLYYNELSKNISDVYKNGKMKDIGLKDIWIEYTDYFNTIGGDHDVEQLYENYVLKTPWETKLKNINFSKLINIINHDKLNMIGNDKYALSEKWFRDNPKDVKQLKNNVLNYYNNIIKDDSKKYLWTTYIQHYHDLKGKGYTKGFCHTGDGQRSDYKDRIYLAYLENNFTNQTTTLTQDQYALAYFLRFLFKSGIREGKRITVYIPSRRMRELLEKWIEEQNYED